MWKSKIKRFIFVSPDTAVNELLADKEFKDGALDIVKDMMDERIKNALRHYCEFCDRGFATAHGTKNHKRIIHTA